MRPFETLSERLLAGGVAPRHVRRYIAELEEHLDDSARRQREAGYDAQTAILRARALLGDDADLAKAMLERPQFRSLAARAPWAVFVLLPPLTAIAALLPPTLLLVFIGRSHDLLFRSGHYPPEWFRALAGIISTGCNLLLVPLVTALFVRLALRQRLSLRWPLIAVAIMLLLFVRLNVQFPVPGHHGSIGVGIIPLFIAPARHLLAEEWPSACAQWLLTLLPALWLWRRSISPPLPS